ncbi:hypothetical protein EAO28_11600 [Klebsiella pneumoniae]|uniref:Uncharacterized protein n=1 Tax=Klebsiella pneumoniae TaxID=573 RepID=A0A3P2EIH1_KLEPN|nr:hypothetical protein EAO28_11600 [Klebsiella pneumoniae]
MTHDDARSAKPLFWLASLRRFRYSFLAVAKSTAGRRNPCNSQATTDAPCVFFTS